MPTVAKTFSAADQVSATFLLTKGQTGTYVITGTFVGTLKLERSINGGTSWEPVSSFTTTASSTILYDEGAYRFRCSAYTSGSPAITLAERDDVLQEWQSKDGKTAFRITEGGIEVVGTATWDTPGAVSATLFNLTGIETTLTAHAGGTQAAALALSATKTIHHVTVCATNADSVKLPAATAGAVHFVKNSGAATLQVFGASTETIDDVASATGIAMLTGTGAWFVCVTTGKWYTVKGG